MAKCKVYSCNRKVYAKGYCSRHYQQLLKHGRILERTMFDPNEFIFKDNICYIQLYNQEGDKVAQALVDVGDYYLAEDHKWGLCISRGLKYVGSRINGEYICLHQFLLETRNGADHRNGNPLDNRRSNLRVCSQADNTLNRGFNKNNKSGYKGVIFYSKTNKWRARIGYRGIKRHIGYYDTPKEAAIAYNNKALELHKEFAKINNL